MKCVFCDFGVRPKHSKKNKINFIKKKETQTLRHNFKLIYYYFDRVGTVGGNYMVDAF